MKTAFPEQNFKLCSWLIQKVLNILQILYFCSVLFFSLSVSFLCIYINILYKTDGVVRLLFGKKKEYETEWVILFHKIILLTLKWALKTVGFASTYWSELHSLKLNYCPRMIIAPSHASHARRNQCATKWCFYMIKENKYPLKGTLSFSSLVCSSGAGDCDLQFAHWRVFQIGESSDCRSAWLLLLSENDMGLQTNC